MGVAAVEVGVAKAARHLLLGAQLLVEHVELLAVEVGRNVGRGVSQAEGARSGGAGLGVTCSR